MTQLRVLWPNDCGVIYRKLECAASLLTGQRHQIVFVKNAFNEMNQRTTKLSMKLSQTSLTWQECELRCTFLPNGTASTVFSPGSSAYSNRGEPFRRTKVSDQLDTIAIRHGFQDIRPRIIVSVWLRGI